MDQSKLHAVISDNRAGCRPADIPNADLDEFIAELGYNSFEELELFDQQDMDIRATQELMVGNTSGNPVGSFRTLVNHVIETRELYMARIEGLTETDLAQEAKREGHLQQVQVTARNCSVFRTYKRLFLNKQSNTSSSGKSDFKGATARTSKNKGVISCPKPKKIACSKEPKTLACAAIYKTFSNISNKVKKVTNVFHKKWAPRPKGSEHHVLHTLDNISEPVDSVPNRSGLLPKLLDPPPKPSKSGPHKKNPTFSNNLRVLGTVSAIGSAPRKVKHFLGDINLSGIQSIPLPPRSSNLVSCHCDAVDHSLLYQCDTFINLKPTMRVSIVESLGACRYCLLNHPGPCRYINHHNCPAQDPGDRHNRMLCPVAQCASVTTTTAGFGVSATPDLFDILEVCENVSLRPPQAHA